MAEEPRSLYWDAVCFTSYINGDPDRRPHLEAILDEAHRSNGRIIIATSVLSKVEVAFSVAERAARALSEDEEARITDLWSDTSALALADVHELIVDSARHLVRTAMVARLSLKAADAIHLATATSLGAAVFQTYDQKLLNPEYAALTGLTITRPIASAPRLPDM